MNKTHDFKLNMPDYSDAVDIDILNDNFRVIDDALMAGLCEKEYTGNNMGSSDPATRKYAWAPWFEIKNENDFDVQVTDRNFETTITIEAGGTYRKYIVGTYYMNFYVQDQHDVTFRWFTDAETRINEIDPSGGGSVSSVNVTGASSSHIVTSGGPITSSGTIEIDLAEGYSIPQTNKQTSWDGKAADLKAEIDSSTYVLTLQLKDSAGNLIGNERTIDLPLETMVVDGEYDPQSKKIKLELKNGNYVEFSVADLVSGLQTELSSSNKLDPTYIAYDTTHRVVSDTEKDTWNGKQNAISDLETIRSGAAAGATAVQPSVMEDALDDKQDSIDGSHKLSSDLVDDTNKTNKFVTSTEKNTWNSKQNALTFDDAPTSGSNNPVKSGGIYTALSGKQGTIDSSHKLSSALVSFSTAQNAALSSGIDSTKVSQISTNQTNILYAINTGVKNLAIIDSFQSQRNGNISVSGNSITVSGTTSWCKGWQQLHIIRGMVYKITYKVTANTSANACVNVDRQSDFTDHAYQQSFYSQATGTYTGEFTAPSDSDYLYLSVTSNNSSSTLSTATSITITDLMICPKSVYEQDSSYNNGALPNYDLTRLEAEDRASLAEVVDSGAKNLIVGGWYKGGDDPITFTANSDGSVTVTKSSTTASAVFLKSTLIALKTGTSYVAYSGSDNAIVQLRDSNGNTTYGSSTSNTPFTVPSNANYMSMIRLAADFTGTVTCKPMLCTKAAFGVSNKFTPYRPSYQDLVNATNIEVLSGSDIFTANTDYTIIGDGFIYKQGKHIFGTLIVSKSDGNFTGVETAIGQMKSAYRPVKLYIGNNTTFNTSQWGVNGIGYCYIPASGASSPNVIIKTSPDDSQKFNVATIKLDYCTT